MRNADCSPFKIIERNWHRSPSQLPTSQFVLLGGVARPPDLAHHAAATLLRRDLLLASRLDAIQMLRYAGYIDAASNMYEVPRPPRRGSHRPEAVFDYARQTGPRKMSPSWMNVVAGSPPTTMSSTVSVARPSLSAEQSSVLGKRMQMAISPIVSKEEQDQFLDVERVLMSSRVRKNFRNETTCARHVSQYPIEGQNYQHAVKQGCKNPISTRSSPISTLKVDKLRTPVSVDLVSQMSSGVRNTLSPQRSILESYTQTMPLSASCQTVQKRCMHPDCTKISVTRGLCRGHGGGRRCHFTGCSKSAQSRSTFCWAHGGGQRCEVQGCMRSRKSKRFCVAHVHFENTGWLNSGTSTDWRMQERRGTWQGQPVLCKQQAPALSPQP